MAHHELAPSSYPAWTICPHWTSKQSDDDGSAAEGTKAHELLHNAFEDKINLNDAEETADIDKNLLFVVKRAYDGLNAILDGIFEWSGYWSKHSEVFLETDGLLPAATFGTADLVARSEDAIVVADYKHRYSDRDYTAQLAAYAVMWANHFHHFRDDEVHLIVWYGDTGTHTMVKKTIAECEHIASYAQLSRLNAATRPRKASPWCSLCEHCGACPAAQGLVSKGVAIIPETENAVVPPEKIAPMMTICAEIEKRIKAFKSWAKEYALENGGIYDEDGNLAYQVKTTNQREIILDSLFENTKGIVTAKDIVKACTINQTAIKKLLQPKGLKLKEIDEIISNSSITSPVTKLEKVKVK